MWSSRTCTSGVLGLALAIGAFSGPAHGQSSETNCGAGGNLEDSAGNVEFEGCPDDPVPSGDDGESATPVSQPVECTDELRNDPDAWFVAYDPDWNQVDGHEESRLIQTDREEGQVIAVLEDCSGTERSSPYWADPPEPGEADTFDDVIAARDRAFARLDLDDPQPTFAPDGRTFAGVPAWLWLDDDWQVLEAADESPGGVTVSVRAEPHQLTWSTPEGERICDGPGIPWTSQDYDAYQRQPAATRGTGDPACTFVFTDTSTDEPDGVYATTVTVAWSLSWSLAGGPDQDLGTLDLASDLPIEVGEVRSVRTR